MKGLVVTGGEAPSREALEPFLRGVELTVAADSGLDSALELGLTVDLVVGDMDSLLRREALSAFPPSRVLRYDAAKDETDTEIGVRVLRERGCDEIVIAGGGGGRTDHLLGILALFERARPPSAWVAGGFTAILLTGRNRLVARPGETLSFFALGEEVRVLSSSGLRWPLDGMCLGRASPSLSNEATSDTIGVDVGEGRLLMLKDAGDRDGGARKA